MLISKLEKKLYLEVTTESKLKIVDEVSDKVTFELKTLTNKESTKLMVYLEAAKKEIDTLEGNGIEKFMNYMEGLIIEIHNSSIKPHHLQIPTLISIADKLLAESVVSMEEATFLG